MGLIYFYRKSNGGCWTVKRNIVLLIKRLLWSLKSNLDGLKLQPWYRSIVVSLFPAGEDQCSARPFSCMLPPPLSTATLEVACMPSKEVKESQCMCLFKTQTECLSLNKFSQLFSVWIVQADDGSSKCSLGHFWSQQWFVGQPSS